MFVPATTLTIGGLFIGMALPLWHVSRFAVGSIKNGATATKGALDLVPLGVGMLYGGIATATTSGLIGFSTGAITWFGNLAGSFAMWNATGGETTLAARSSQLQLTGMGNLVLLLLTVAVVGAWKAIPKKAKPRMRLGIISGILLGLSATLGGVVMATVIPAVNAAGEALVGTIA
ncbi:hypothetical protein ACGF13_38385 [Kitasatospora sp. NPDC048286]|uniref:hypothetical protein n=1 Tax=Kitasatospora sp. NPDC048286 TaxID=3364047 RepID=UPI00371AEE3B